MAPDHRIVFMLLVVQLGIEIRREGRRGTVFDCGDVFVNERRIEERVVPGKVTFHPAPDDGRELAGL